MDINQIIQWLCKAFLWLIGFIIHNFGLILLFTMIIYAIVKRKEIKAQWGTVYSQIDKKIDPAFKKVESILTKQHGEQQ